MSSQYVCTTCGSLGSPRKQTKGSLGIEIVLWLFFIVPGVIYSIWRLTTKQLVCRKCGSPTVIPTDTPQGKKLVENYHPDQLKAIEEGTSRAKKTLIANDPRLEAGIWLVAVILFIVFSGITSLVPPLIAIGYSVGSRIKK